MSIVVPSILTSSRADLEAKLRTLRGLTDTVQIDVVDGAYAAPATWPYSEGSAAFAELSADAAGLNALGNFRYEIDLMVREPEAAAGAWIAAGASRVVIHLEGAADLSLLIEHLETHYAYDKEFSPDLLSLGLSLNVNTDTALLEPYLAKAGYVQFMGITDIGKQGQPFAPAVVEKIRAFHKLHPDVVIQVDGGVTLATAPDLLDAGADRLVVGHDLWEAADIALELSRFEELATRYGTYE